MKFNKIFLPESITKEKDIEEINISRLGNVVALVGKNGSGKTRILHLLEECLFENIGLPNVFDGSLDGLPEPLDAIRNENETLQAYFRLQAEYDEKVRNKGKRADRKEINKELRAISKQQLDLAPLDHDAINAVKGILDDLSPTLKNKYFRRISSDDIRRLRKSVEESAGSKTRLFEKLVNSRNQDEDYDELTAILSDALTYFLDLPIDLAFEKESAGHSSRVYKRKAPFIQFTSLQKFIKIFMGKKLDWRRTTPVRKREEGKFVSEGGGVWELDGRPFDYEEFSEGEKILFAYALLFFLLDQNPDLSIKESVIIIDEPELHLHPDAEIDVINGIRSIIEEKGQLIIATHSINILSYLDYSEVFIVKSGCIQHPTKLTPGESLKQLMSIEGKVERLSDFLTSISNWAYVNFAVECFKDPDVLKITGRKDPQIEAFKNAVKNIRRSKRSVLLDFGAGKGRVLEQLKGDRRFFESIEYCALEPNHQCHETLTRLGVSAIFSSHLELEDRTFDFILICNVLHEIDVREWESILSKLVKSLRKNGFLILIEARTLSKGEKIGETGFVLLEQTEIQRLFGLKSVPPELNIGPQSEKITCVLMQKERIKISKQSVLEALCSLEKNTFEKIKSLKEMKDCNGYDLGRKYAFYSQQYINAQLGIELLSKEG